MPFKIFSNVERYVYSELLIVYSYLSSLEFIFLSRLRKVIVLVEEKLETGSYVKGKINESKALSIRIAPKSGIYDSKRSAARAEDKAIA